MNKITYPKTPNQSNKSSDKVERTKSEESSENSSAFVETLSTSKVYKQKSIESVDSSDCKAVHSSSKSADKSISVSVQTDKELRKKNKLRMKNNRKKLK